MWKREIKKNYTLQMSESLYAALAEVAEERCISVVELVRRGIKWELMAGLIQKEGGRILVERPGKRVREVMSL